MATMVMGVAPRIREALLRGPSILSPVQVQPVCEINSTGWTKGGRCRTIDCSRLTNRRTCYVWLTSGHTDHEHIIP
jgi:hypothetical protein